MLELAILWAEGHSLKDAARLHSLQKAVMESSGSQTGTPHALSMPTNTVHDNKEQNRWQRAALSRSNMHQEQVGLTACDADHTPVLVIGNLRTFQPSCPLTPKSAGRMPTPDQCQRFLSGEWVTDHFFIWTQLNTTSKHN